MAKLLIERNSQQSIVRATSVARMTMAKLLKKNGYSLATTATAAPEKDATQKAGSPRTGCNANFCRPAHAQSVALVGLTVERDSCRIVARVLSCHDVTARRCGTAALHRYHHWPRPKGSGNTSIVEAVNRSLRQRCGVLVQKSCSFSKSLDRHTARIKNIIDNYTLNLN